MFKCQITGKQSRQGDPRIGELVVIDERGSEDIRGSEKPTKIVVATRPREYKHWDRESEEEWFSYGTEIVKEIDVSEEGLAIWNRMTEEQRTAFVKGLA